MKDPMNTRADLAQEARKLEPGLMMGTVFCDEWLKEHHDCKDCRYQEPCCYFGLGVFVATLQSLFG